MSLSKLNYEQKELRVSIRRLASARMQVPEAVIKVFGLPELREKIISCAVCKRGNDEPVLCRETVQTLRLVSKGCLSTVTKVLEHDKEALFQLTLDRTNSLDETAFVTTHGGKLLDLFVNRMRTAQWNLQDPPTFSLKITEQFFRAENFKSLRNCLVQCGKGLVTLEMVAPRDGGSLCPVFPPYSLPALKTVKMHLSNRLTFMASGETVNVANTTHLLNSVLLASSALTRFSVLFTHRVNHVPQNFELLNLPGTLSKLELLYKLGPSEFTILVRNPLPNLTYLRLALSEIPLPDGEMFQALNNCGKKLEYLELLGMVVTRNAATRVRFPVMEKLKVLCFKGSNLELEPGITSREMAQRFPNLLEMELYLNEAGFASGTQTHYVFPAVKQLQLQLIQDADLNDVEVHRLMTFSLESMQLVHRAFPNVRRLTLTLSSREIRGLQYIFREMKQLWGLHLNVELTPESSNVDFWDALLTGTTAELMAALKACPDLCQTTRFGNHDRPSIFMLTNLVSFTLADFRFQRQNNLRDGNQRLISDLAFAHGFLKMPKLIRLTLAGRFRASQEMGDKWKVEGHGHLSHTVKDVLRSLVVLE